MLSRDTRDPQYRQQGLATMSILCFATSKKLGCQCRHGYDTNHPAIVR